MMNESPQDLFKRMGEERKKAQERNENPPGEEMDAALKAVLAGLVPGAHGLALDPTALCVSISVSVQTLGRTIVELREMSDRLSLSLQILMVQLGITELVVTPELCDALPKQAFAIGEKTDDNGEASGNQFKVKLVPLADVPDAMRQAAEEGDV